MEAKFSNRVKEVISLSREEALRLGHDYIGTSTQQKLNEMPLKLNNS